MEEHIKYKLVPSSSFRRDMKSLSEEERQETHEVIQKLARGEELDEKYRDHQLRGKLKSFRDCHIRRSAPFAWVEIINTPLARLAHTPRLGAHIPNQRRRAGTVPVQNRKPQQIVQALTELLLPFYNPASKEEKL